ncbi:hypothetical protein QFC19_004621 [Naganishia cerealis]|uniref:Uncharacterized protein n=1 Tax=Naganishia cerealis TaxID=610337 RepID=A0ACC2VUT3_9TREE|nr:hypothetical protein QFC19_004621 [Naganishia cerealis]
MRPHLPIIDDDLGLSRPFRIAVDATVFLISLFFLERAADVFVDTTAVIGKRWGVPTILVGLLTAGAEWEELVVVVSSLASNNPSLALSNTLGSSTANIIGSFSIGLIVAQLPAADVPPVVRRSEDLSAKVYTSVLLFLTLLITLVGPLWEYLHARKHTGRHDAHGAGRWVGIILVVMFGLYLAFIAYGIYRGLMVAPEGSSSSSSSEDNPSSPSTSPYAEETDRGLETTDSEEEDAEEDDTTFDRRCAAGERDRRRARNAYRAGRWTATENAPLLPSQRALARRKSTFQITYRLFTSLFLLSLSGFLLTRTSSSLASQAHLSDSAVGITLLAVATTLPEKLVAYKSGVKGHRGVLIANTVGSNIFLQTLVLGVIWIVRGSKVTFDAGSTNGLWIDVVVTLVASLVLWIIVWTQAYRREVGWALVLAYVVYLGSVVVMGRPE